MPPEDNRFKLIQTKLDRDIWITFEESIYHNNQFWIKVNGKDKNGKRFQLMVSPDMKGYKRLLSIYDAIDSTDLGRQTYTPIWVRSEFRPGLELSIFQRDPIPIYLNTLSHANNFKLFFDNKPICPPETKK
jgi:hypothetical protein